MIPEDNQGVVVSERRAVRFRAAKSSTTCPSGASRARARYRSRGPLGASLARKRTFLPNR